MDVIMINEKDWILEEEKISCGEFLPKLQYLILGYNDGLVKIYKFEKEKFDLLFNYQFENRDVVRTISISKTAQFAFIGTLSSETFLIIDLNNLKKAFEFGGNSSKFDRQFDSCWIKDEYVLVCSTYGKIRVYERLNNYKSKTIDTGTTNALFCITCKDDQIIYGDWGGTIRSFLFTGDTNVISNELQGIREPVQNVDYIKNNKNIIFSLGHSGTVQVFKQEKIDDKSEWCLVLRYLSGFGYGNSIKSFNHGSSVFALTKNGIIYLDLDNPRVGLFHLENSFNLFPYQNEYFLINSAGILKIDPKRIKLDPLDSIRYSKIGVIGDTFSGKSTLCAGIIDTIIDPLLKSTEMKNVWDWIIENFEEQQSIHIFLHDFGGQVDIIGSHLQYLLDSDVILIVFTQRDSRSIDVAIKIRETLKQKYSYKNDFIFIQTNKDQPLNDTESKLEKYNEKFSAKEKIVPIRTGIKKIDSKIIIEGIDEVRKKIIEKIKLIPPKIQILSESTKEITNAIEVFQNNNIEILDLEEFYSHIAEKIELRNIWDLYYILRSLSLQGRIELKKIEKNYLIYFNMKKIAKTKNKILQEISSNNGILDWEPFVSKYKKKWVEYEDLEDRTKKDSSDFEGYVGLAKDILIFDNVVISHHNLLINLDFLPPNIELQKVKYEINKNHFKFTPTPEISKNLGQIAEFPFKKLILSLLDLNLTIILLSETTTLLKYENNSAYLYSIFHPAGVFDNSTIDFHINGENKETKDHITLEIHRILNGIFK